MERNELTSETLRELGFKEFANGSWEGTVSGVYAQLTPLDDLIMSHSYGNGYRITINSPITVKKDISTFSEMAEVFNMCGAKLEAPKENPFDKFKKGDIITLSYFTIVYEGYNDDKAILYSFIINTEEPNKEMCAYHIGKPNTGVGYITDGSNKNARLATEEEKGKLLKRLDEDGYKLEDGKVVKKSEHIMVDGRKLSDEELDWTLVDIGDVVIEGDIESLIQRMKEEESTECVVKSYRTLTDVQGADWVYFDGGYYHSTSPVYCHYLVKGQKNCVGSKLIRIKYKN